MNEVKATVEVTYPIRHEDGLPQDLPEGVNIPEFNKYFAGTANYHSGYSTMMAWSTPSDHYRVIEFEFYTIGGAKAFIEDIETDFACPPCQVRYLKGANNE